MNRLTGISACIDIDAVWADFGLPDGRVAVHHDLAEIFFVRQEILPDPEQVMSALLAQRNSRTRARMGEEEVPACER